MDQAIRKNLILKIFIPFALGYFLSFLYRTINAIISTDLTASVALNASDLGLLTSVYFLSIAFFQLPLGILLDKYGPKRVEVWLLLVAAVGAFVFAYSDSLSELILGRALIGIGVSACLMAAFKAFVDWFPMEQLPTVNGWVMASGGFGALCATLPVEAALQITDWRGIFLFLGAFTLLTAFIIQLCVIEKTEHRQTSLLSELVSGLMGVLSDRYFWTVAPITVLSQACFFSIQGLWAAPWLRDVAGMDRTEISNVLFLTAVAMVAGFLLMGSLASRLNQIGFKPVWVAAIGMLIFTLLQLLLVLDLSEYSLYLWILFGFFGTSGIINYAVMSKYFPPQLAGRVNTAINMLVFVLAFIAQWGIGAIVNQWRIGDGYSAVGYEVAFITVVVLQFGCLVWFFLGVRRYQ